MTAAFVASALLLGSLTLVAHAAVTGTSTVPTSGTGGGNAFGQYMKKVQDAHKALMQACVPSGNPASTSSAAAFREACQKAREDFRAQHQQALTDMKAAIDAWRSATASGTAAMKARKEQLRAEMKAKVDAWKAERDARFKKMCEQFKNASTTPPAGFASAFEVAGDKDKLVSARCDAATGDVAVDVGDDETTTYVYEKGYKFDQGKWKQIDLLSDNEKKGQWFVGKAFTDADFANASGTTYMLGYTCSRESGTWKCGCKDAACTQPGWQLQTVTR